MSWGGSPGTSRDPVRKASGAKARWLAWWRQADHYDRVTWFLRDHELMRPTQKIMAFVAFSSALVPSSVILSSGSPSIPVVVVCLASMATALGMTIYWLTHWPTRRQSVVACMAGIACVTGWAVAGPGTVIPVLSGTAFAVTGGYVAFFHSVKLLTANIVLAVVTGIALTVRIADSVGWPIAVSVFWTLWLLNTAVPISIRSMSWALTHYAERANTDSLTGLLNRRGFLDEVCRVLSGESHCDVLVTAMVDLDDFKRVNDVFGHAAGDHILRSVSAVLRMLFPSRSAICRSGGEEFLVAFCTEADRSVDVGDQICEAIRRKAVGVTASVGVATTTPGGSLSKYDVESLLARQVAAADAAMYEAKRLGGDRASAAREH